MVPHTHTSSQLFITVMDKLRLEIRAMDEVRLPEGTEGWRGGLEKGVAGAGVGEGSWQRKPSVLSTDPA